VGAPKENDNPQDPSQKTAWGFMLYMDSLHVPMLSLGVGVPPKFCMLLKNFALCLLLTAAAERMDDCLSVKPSKYQETSRHLMVLLVVRQVDGILFRGLQLNLGRAA
jgi:hypothetical protein